jgi:two-component system chemotaxis sensor kinase CheA
MGEIESKLKNLGEIDNVHVEEIASETAKKSFETVEQEKVFERETTLLENSTQINSVNVELTILDQLLEYFGELLIKTKQTEHKMEDLARDDIKEDLYQMQNFMSSIQNIILQMQLVPLATIFRVYPRMVRTISQREGKKVNLLIQNNDVKVDRKILNQIGEILNHVIRNAVYHGIESEQIRRSNGKMTEGKIVVDTRIESNVLKIEISDDGKGINPEKIAQAAIEKGLYSQEEIEKMDEAQIINIIFESNFSTAEKADLTSGRGLGLSIVKNKVELLGGSIDIDTKIGEGTTFIIQLPISRSLIRALLIRVEDQTYAISLDDVQNLIETSIDDIRVINNQEYLILSDKKELLRIYRLNNLFKISAISENIVQKTFKLVHIKKGDKNYALVVDEFLKESEIVIKKIDDMPKDVKGISGATILDDGTVTLIIDPFTVVF